MLRARYATGVAGSVKPAWPSVVGALMGRAGSGLNWRQVVLSAAVGFWATRRKFFIFLLGGLMSIAGLCVKADEIRRCK